MTASSANSAFSSLGEEFCWQARSFAAMYGARSVDAVHILLAAAEVTPVEVHGYDELTPAAISVVLEAMHIENASEGISELITPTELTPQAQELVARAASFASRTKRVPTLRDVWVALSQQYGLVYQVFEQLGIDPGKLYRQVSGS